MTHKPVNADLTIEQDSHDRLYSNLRHRLKGCNLTWKEFYSRHCTPPHEGGQLYGLDIQIYLDRLDSIFETLPSDSRILDYGCGMGEMSVAIATRGFDVTGFDLSGVGIETARFLAEQANVSESTRFCVANAQALPFTANTFDLVLGKAVLHHTVKYPGTNTELYRVMKPGSQGRQFSKVDITGYFLLYMIKRLGFEGYNDRLEPRGHNSLGTSRAFRRLLKTCLFVDRLLVNERRFSAHVAGRYLIELRR